MLHPWGQEGFSCPTELVTALIAPALDAALDFAGLGMPEDLTLIDSAISLVRWNDWLALNGLTAAEAAARPSFDRAAMAIAAAAQGVGVVLESTRLAAEELARRELVETGGGSFREMERELHFLSYRAARRNVAKIAAFRFRFLQASARN
jgi:DNA-binding transcriptional LysR family regulator